MSRAIVWKWTYDETAPTLPRIGGRLLVYSLQGTKVLPLDNVNNFNQHWKFKTGTGRTPIEISLAYRPPSSGAENTEKLCDVLRTWRHQHARIDWDQGISNYKGRDLLRTMEEEEMMQLVSFSTHTKGGLLDLFVTNCPDGIVSIHDEGHLRKSDHSIILFEAEDMSRSITGGKPT